MSERFRCSSCGHERFYEHRLELVPQNQLVSLVLGEGSLRPDDYLSGWESLDSETLFVNGYECAACKAVYAPDGSRVENLLDDPGIYVGERPAERSNGEPLPG